MIRAGIVRSERVAQYRVTLQALNEVITVQRGAMTLLPTGSTQWFSHRRHIRP